MPQLLQNLIPAVIPVPCLALALILLEIVGPIEVLVAADIALMWIFRWFVHVGANWLLLLAEVGQSLLDMSH